MTHGVDASAHVSGGGQPVETWTVLRMILWSAEYLESRGVKSARLDAEHLLAHVRIGRQQHDRRLDACLAHVAADFEPLLLWEHHVEQDQVERLRNRLSDRRFPVRHDLGRVPIPA